MSKLRFFFLLDMDLLSILMTLTHSSQPEPGGSSARPLGYGVEKNRDIPSGWKRKSLEPSGKALKVPPFVKLASALWIIVAWLRRLAKGWDSYLEA